MKYGERVAIKNNTKLLLQKFKLITPTIFFKGRFCSGPIEYNKCLLAIVLRRKSINNITACTIKVYQIQIVSRIYVISQYR